jgi:hypothetical protein
VYTAKSPLGLFTYARRNPILVHRNGLINGTGHHCVIEGPDGNLWAVYTVLYRNWGVFDRRIGLDPVGLDKDGNMFLGGPSETRRRGPGSGAHQWMEQQAARSLYPSTGAPWSASSSASRGDPTYAFDNNVVRTWWQPAGDDAQPWLMLDLGCRNPTDPNQEFVIDSSRILFDAAPPERTSLSVDGHSTWFPNARGIIAAPYRYKLEVSSDNRTFQVVADKTDNAAANNVEFDEFAPVRCLYVRLTVTGRPANVSMAILEFTVFGKSAPSPRTGTTK